MVRFLVDECLPERLVSGLQKLGHDVEWVARRAPSAADPTILEMAIDLDRIIVSEDRDFGLLAVRRRPDMPGLVLLYLSEYENASDDLIAQCVDQISALGPELVGQLTIIQPGRIRQRKLDHE